MKLHLTVGLPRAGKSTWARSTGWPIVNPDSIRMALHGQAFFGPAEPFVWAIAHTMVEALRLAGHENVILDAANVSLKRREEWTREFPDAELHVFDTPPEVCASRAVAEGRHDLLPVIKRMANSWDLPMPATWASASQP